jgi:hypothetical protein
MLILFDAASSTFTYVLDDKGRRAQRAHALLDD